MKDKIYIEGFKKTEFPTILINCEGVAINTNNHHNTKRICTLYVDKDGYTRIWVKNHKDEKKFVLVHRLVAKAFLKNDKNLKQVNHINGDKSNNHAENLEWCNQSHNMKHAHQVLKITKYGENTVNAKLTNAQANEIRKYKGKRKLNDLALIYGVHPNTIGRIMRNETYVEKN